MSFEEYLADIVRVPMLTCDEEIILGSHVQQMMKVLRDNGISEQISEENLYKSAKDLEPQARRAINKGVKARNRMISANMRLVVAVAKKIKTSQVHLTIQDLMQEGAIGLARAAEKFEPGRGYKFSTYAYWWIRQAIVRATEYQEKAIRLPSNLQKTAKQIREARERLALKFDREPTIPEIAEEIEETVEKVKRTVLMDSVTVSLDSAINCGDDQASMLELIPASVFEGNTDAEDDAEKFEAIAMLISALSAEEQELIKQKYGIGCQVASTKEISEASGLSKQVIRQRQQKITDKIKYAMSIFFSIRHS
jgi:RNA polymerase sigma factor (sigma-70 family)